MNRWQSVARQVAAMVGPREGAALLVVSCLHNRGFRFLSCLDRALQPDVIVNVGDVSGIGGPVEAVIVRLLWRARTQQIFSLGNHDSDVTAQAMLRKRAAVLANPRLVSLTLPRVGQDIHAWGYADPNRSTLGGPPYDSNLCKEAAKVNKPPAAEHPYLIAVHNSRMVSSPPSDVKLILCGHRHEPRVERGKGPTIARCGTTGGGGLHWPWKKPGPCQALVVDLALPEHRPDRIWMVETDGQSVRVQEG